MAISYASCGPHTTGRLSRQMSRVPASPQARSASRPHLITPLACLMHRTYLQRSSASIAAANSGGASAHMNCVRNVSVKSFAGLSEDDSGATLSGLGADGSASNEPIGSSATRRQLDQFFMTLWKDKNIATEHICDLCSLSALELECDCGWIGYCYYTVSAPNADCCHEQTGNNMYSPSPSRFGSQYTSRRHAMRA